MKEKTTYLLSLPFEKPMSRREDDTSRSLALPHLATVWRHCYISIRVLRQWLLANPSRTNANVRLFLRGIRFTVSVGVTVRVTVRVRLKVFLTRLTLGVLYALYSSS